MNKKGFTLVELLSVLVILGLIVGITIPVGINVMNHSKDNSERAFVSTIKDAMNIYLSGNEKSGLGYETCGTGSVYEYATITFRDVISSSFKPINTASLVNPKNDKNCGDKIDEAEVKIIRHKTNYVYYYVIDKSSFGYKDKETDVFYKCLTLEMGTAITNFDATTLSTLKENNECF